MLAENFRCFAKVKRHQFLTSKSCPKLSRLYFAFNFCKSLTETTKIIKNFSICQKFQYIFHIFNIWRYLSKIDGYFRNFCLFLMKIRPSCTQLARYINSKNAFKTVLARTGAKINGFLCFDHLTDWLQSFMGHVWPLFEFQNIRNFR